MGVKRETWHKLVWAAAGAGLLAVMWMGSRVAEEDRRSRERSEAIAAQYQAREQAKKDAAACLAQRATRSAKEAIALAHWGPYEERPAGSFGGGGRSLEVVTKGAEALRALAGVCEVPVSAFKSNEEMAQAMADTDAEMKEIEGDARIARARQKTREDEAKAQAAAAAAAQSSWAIKP